MLFWDKHEVAFLKTRIIRPEFFGDPDCPGCDCWETKTLKLSSEPVSTTKRLFSAERNHRQRGASAARPIALVLCMLRWLSYWCMHSRERGVPCPWRPCAVNWHWLAREQGPVRSRDEYDQTRARHAPIFTHLPASVHILL